MQKLGDGWLCRSMADGEDTITFLGDPKLYKGIRSDNWVSPVRYLSRSKWRYGMLTGRKLIGMGCLSERISLKLPRMNTKVRVYDVEVSE